MTFDTVNTTKEEHELTLQTQAFLTDISGDTGISSAAATQEVTFPVGTHANEITYSLGTDAAFWSEYTPVVYRFEMMIMENKDKTITTFGLRDFTTTETEFLINGTPTFLRGKHDGLIFPLTGAVPGYRG